MTTTNSDTNGPVSGRENGGGRRWEDVATRLHNAVSSRRALALGVSVSVHLLIAVAAGTVVLSTRAPHQDKRDLVINLGALETSPEAGPEHWPAAAESEIASENDAAEVENDEFADREVGPPEEEPEKPHTPVAILAAEPVQTEPVRETVERVVAPLEQWVDGYAQAREAAMQRATRRPRTDRAVREAPDESAAPPSTERARAPVTFAGSGVSEAESVVFVVDASGPMVTSLPIVLEEVKRSVDALAPKQRFSVVLFREARRNGRERTERFSDRLVEATTEQKSRLAQWLSKARPGGASNPLTGLEAGLALKPDVVFLLSRSVERSEGGVWGEGLEATLQRLERLNPDLGRGGRRVQIQTIAFLENDPTGTLQEIAKLHGPRDGTGYRIVRGSEELARGGRTVADSE